MLRKWTGTPLVGIPFLILGIVLLGPSASGASGGRVHPTNNAAEHAVHHVGHANGRTAGTFGDVSQPQPLSTADMNTGGANGQCPGGPYCSTRDGSPSLNGSGDGKAVGLPCAGCVGRADNKNPAGQLPDGADANAGYECDRNSGIGRSNPAHTSCRTNLKPPVQPSGGVLPPSPGHLPTGHPEAQARILPNTGSPSGSWIAGLAGIISITVGGWLVRGSRRSTSAI
jgi:LPXTG-motif cell wall-anchored protein